MPNKGLIHDTAIVHPSAVIHPTAMIGPYCIVGPNVKIDKGTQLLNHVTVQSDTTIGSNNRFFPFAVIGGDPQDKKFDGEETTLQIGNENEIREHVTIHRGTGQGGGETIIGNQNLLMVSSHVAHDCILGDGIVIANQVMLAGHIKVDDYATIGGGAGINQFSSIGRCSYIGGLARITKDVPPYMIVEGSPAEIRAVNVVAMSRLGYSEAEINAMKEGFKRLFRENSAAFSDRIDEFLQAYGQFDCTQHLCNAIQASANGRHGRSNEKLASME